MKTETENTEYSEADFLDHKIEEAETEIDELTARLAKAKRNLKFLEKKLAQIAPKIEPKTPVPCPTCDENAKKIEQLEIQFRNILFQNDRGILPKEQDQKLDEPTKPEPPQTAPTLPKTNRVPKWLINLWNLIKDIFRGGVK